MFSKTLSTAVLAASLAFTPAGKAAADAGDFVAGAIIGGIIGHAATKDAQRKKSTKTRTTTTRTYRSTIPRTQEGREIQSSLNYFGFNAGGVDGQIGRRTREAISRYQIYMGYPATGQLTPLEQEILITSHKRAQLGGFQINQQMATHPDGARGLLKNYRIELAGGAVQAPQPVPAQTTVVVAPQAVSPVTPAPALPNLGVTAAAPALPNFQAVPTPASLAAHCNAISLVTNTNGGYVTTISSATDPDLVLNEQFCLARTYAIENSERLTAQVAGLTPTQIAQQCEAFGPAMTAYVSSLAVKTQAAVVQDVQGFIPATGMSVDQLQGTALICLGVGYRTDNMPVALGSALLLVGAGQPAYAELIGHHLMRGFGVAPRGDIARSWFDQGFTALSSGVVPVFNPGEPGRAALLQQAVAQMN
jgi:peptidoglycan hydrolase-like protein with peptidoglycan-binding domain